MRWMSCASSSIMYASDAPRRRWRYILPPVQLLLLLLLLAGCQEVCLQVHSTTIEETVTLQQLVLVLMVI
jgi:hypothetical protein